MRNLALITFTATVIIATAGSPAAAAPADGEIRPAASATVVPDSYIVVLKHGTSAALAARYGGTIGHTYRHALSGFEISMPERAAKRLAGDPAVAYVQRNGIFPLAGTQSPVPSWGLDRIDQRNLPLNNSYTYPVTASGVRAYIIDTGIRFTHSDFGGRAVTGFDAVDGGPADDCHGHGTHVAGTTGGSSYGVAKGVSLIGVRVLDCAGSGSYAQVIAGVRPK